MGSKDLENRAVETRLVHDSDHRFGTVATPVHRASTVLFENYAEFRRISANPMSRTDLYYGRMGTPSTRVLEDALSALDGSSGAVLAPSGLASIADVLLCLLRAGDHLLMVDSTYGPTRNLCRGLLAERGIETTFYDPLTGSGISELIRPETRVLYTESPGSATFEVQDIPSLTAVARERGVVTVCDNTWATPLLFNPLDYGIDIAVQSGTKYLNGHADCLFGVATTRDTGLLRRLRAHARATGTHLAPDDCYLARRGLRTLALRLERHGQTAATLAKWFAERPEVSRVLHPALPDCPGNEFFLRDFKGASGLFGVVIDDLPEPRLERLLDSLRLFGMGFSWGGFESLVLPMSIQRETTDPDLAPDQVLLRIHAGLEAPSDLIADLEQAFAAAFAA